MRALVAGSAPCLHDDLARLEGVQWDRVYAVNFAAFLLPRVDVWVSGHAEVMPSWQVRWREEGRGPLPEIAVTKSRMHLRKEPCHDDRYVHVFWDGQPKRHRMDSTFLAVKVALEDGADRVVVVGAPLDRSGNLNGYTPEGHTYVRYHRAWLWAAGHRFHGKVKAMSGFPGRMLGAPTEKWLGSPLPTSAREGTQATSRAGRITTSTSVPMR
jgi:hypothetical protein